MLDTNKRYAFIEEFKPFGLLDKFLRKIEQGQSIDLAHMLTELMMQETMAGIIIDIEKKGIKSHIKTYDGAYFALELTNCNMTFG